LSFPYCEGDMESEGDMEIKWDKMDTKEENLYC
jgi:hypothetical protein